MATNGDLIEVNGPPIPAGLDVFRVGELLAKSGYFAGVKDMAQAVCKILAGQEMGFGPIASLTGIYIQNQRICYAANFIAAAIKRSHKYNFKIKKLDATCCSLEFYEQGKALEPISTFTLDDAKTAELLTGVNSHSWKHYPRNMLFARALTNGARWHCADLFGGIPPYTPEEFDVVVDAESGEAVSAPEQADKPLDPPPGPLSATQLKHICIVQKEHGISDEFFKEFLTETYGIKSRTQIPAAAVEDVLGWLRSGPPADATEVGQY